MTKTSEGMWPKALWIALAINLAALLARGVFASGTGANVGKYAVSCAAAPGNGGWHPFSFCGVLNTETGEIRFDTR